MAAMANPYQYMPTEPGKSSDQVGFEKLCTRWNQEEAEADGEDANVPGDDVGNSVFRVFWSW